MRGQEGGREVDFYSEKAGGDGQRITGMENPEEAEGCLRMGKICTCSQAEGMEWVGNATDER